MPAIEVFVTIAASPMAVSDMLLDIDSAPLWTSGLERFELVEGVLGQPGSLGMAHYVEGGRRTTMKDRLVEATPGHHFRSEVTGGGLRASVETDLEEVADGTRLTVRWTGSATNLLTRLLLPFLTNRIRKRSRSDLMALKRLVEERDGHSSGSVDP